MVEDENYCVTQQVTCLTTDVCQAADPGVVSLIPAQSHTFVEIDHEIISNVILPPQPIQEGLFAAYSSMYVAKLWLLIVLTHLARRLG